MMAMQSADPLDVSVYLAGASRECSRVRKWADALERAAGICISLRWYSNVEAWIGLDHALSRSDQNQIAERSEYAIRTSRIFWLLWPEREIASGALVELGYARAHRFHVQRAYDIVVSGEHARDSVFTASADYRDASDALAFDVVLQLAARHRAVQPRQVP